MTPKIEIFGQNLLILEVLMGYFHNFWGQEIRFLEILKVVLQLFKNCKGIIFDLKRPTSFLCIFSSKGC